MKPIPAELRSGPFTRAAAIALDVSPRMLRGQRFVRVHSGVYHAQAESLDYRGQLQAARLALPDNAHLTGMSRIRELGLDYGPELPIHFVVDRDLHLVLEGVFLHRTVKLPPLDAVGVTPAAALLSYHRHARVIDAIKVGSWLLHNKHASRQVLLDLATAESWRDGADETLWILDHLDARCRSIKESETKSVLDFAGLPQAEPNAPVDLGEDREAFGDLVYRRYRVVVEYESVPHQKDRDRYHSDIDRYALFRDHGHRYVQVTDEKLSSPRSVVGSVYRELVKGGYDGPPPTFGEHWKLLFSPLSQAVGPRDRRGRRDV